MPCPAAQLLPYGLPDSTDQRMILRCLRRMAAHGLRDANAALLVFDRFGTRFRQPLVLLRAFVAELARSSARTITLAPCCTHRMTQDEARILAVLAHAGHDPCHARDQLCLLAGDRNVEAPLSIAAALARTLAGPGQPMAL